MKTVYLIGGTMGVGKTTVCQCLKRKLENSVFLDGDWCWDSYPFQVTEETKRMVIKNICFLLNQFIHCSAYSDIIFGWVMHEQSIIDKILAGIDAEECNVKSISLMCSEQTLQERLKRDIAEGLREEDIIQRSLSYLPLFQNLNTIKIETTGKTTDEIVMDIIFG